MRLSATLFVCMGISFISGIGIARSSYPSVGDLEVALHLSPGQQLPKDVQASSGIIFHSYYDGARELNDGRYAIIVRLAP